jgi:hypothetical protein
MYYIGFMFTKMEFTEKRLVWTANQIVSAV